MRTPLRNVVLAMAAGLSVLVLAQTPVRAQARRVPPKVTPVPPRVVPVTPVAPIVRPVPRTPIVVPPVRAYTNPYVLPGLTLNQLGTLSVLSMDPMLMASINNYYNLFRPIYITPVYPAVPYTAPLGTPGITSASYSFYNPYFAAFGLYP